jgi:glycosyltransferase involved in cell wall biosynthesis
VIVAFFNEEKTISPFLKNLKNVLDSMEGNTSLLLINDGSTDNSLQQIENFVLKSDLSLNLLNLEINIGQQAAFKSGLNFAAASGYLLNIERILFIDSDGEDDVKAIPELLKSETEITFATRGSRSEGWLFKFLYIGYKILFKIVTGNKINFGNFVMIQKSVFPSLIQKEFVHLAAFLSKLRFSKGYIEVDRKPRIGGESKVGFKGLFLHSLHSLMEYTDELIYFLFKCLGVLILLSLIVFSWIIKDKLLLDKAIPGWSSVMIMISLTMFFQLLGFMLVIVFLKTLRFQHILNKNINSKVIQYG